MNSTRSPTATASVAALSPYLSQKRIPIRNTPGGRMLAQLTREYRSTPGLGAADDDGPDALATAEEMANHIINRSGEVDGVGIQVVWA